MSLFNFFKQKPLEINRITDFGFIDDMNADELAVYIDETDKRLDELWAIENEVEATGAKEKLKDTFARQEEITNTTLANNAAKKRVKGNNDKCITGQMQDKKTEPETTKAECSLEFRTRNYDGKYMFDWLRKGDMIDPEKTTVNDNSFEETMGKHYTTTGDGKKIVSNDPNNYWSDFKPDKEENTDVYIGATTTVCVNNKWTVKTDYKLDNKIGNGKMFTKLQNEYTPIFKFAWNGTDGKPCTVHTPVLIITPGVKAFFNMHINVPDTQKKPDRIVLEFYNWQRRKIDASQYLFVGRKQISAAELKDGLNKDYWQAIECKAEFANECFLIARACAKGQTDDEGEICGMMRILPNNEAHRHKIKIVLVQVKTSINEPISMEVTEDMESMKEMKEFFYRQALIDIEYEVINDFEATDEKYKKDYYTTEIIDNNGKRRRVINGDKGSIIIIDFNKKLGAEYANCYKLYFMNELCPSALGISTINTHAGEAIASKSTIFFANYYNTSCKHTSAHELIHATGFTHTFDGNNFPTQPLVYKALTTNNVMDYPHLSSHYNGIVTLFYTQIKEIWNRIDKPKTNKK